MDKKTKEICSFILVIGYFISFTILIGGGLLNSTILAVLGILLNIISVYGIIGFCLVGMLTPKSPDNL